MKGNKTIKNLTEEFESLFHLENLLQILITLRISQNVLYHTSLCSIIYLLNTFFVNNTKEKDLKSVVGNIR